MKSGVMKYLESEEQNTDMSLQITSMADIFVIILVFLLKSFSTGLATLSPNQGMQLPNVTTSVQSQIKDATKIEILSNAILVDQKKVADIDNFEIKELKQALQDSTQPVENGAIFKPVLDALLVEKQKDEKAGKVETNLLVMADERTPYATLKAIMASAASAGYTDLQLVVMGNN